MPTELPKHLPTINRLQTMPVCSKLTVSTSKANNSVCGFLLIRLIISTKSISFRMHMPWLLLHPYLQRLKFIPDISFTGGLKWSEFGKDSLDVNVIDSRKRSENSYSMLTSFYKYVSEARGSETHSRFLTTFDTKNTVKASKELFSYDNYMLMNTCSNDLSTPKVKFLNDSVVEVRNYVENEIGGVPYHWYTKYEYYSIGADGSVTSLGNGLFPMTAAIILTKEHFKGCFSRGMDDEEIANSEIYDEDMGGVAD